MFEFHNSFTVVHGGKTVTAFNKMRNVLNALMTGKRYTQYIIAYFRDGSWQRFTTEAIDLCSDPDYPLFVTVAGELDVAAAEGKTLYSLGISYNGITLNNSAFIDEVVISPDYPARVTATVYISVDGFEFLNPGPNSFAEYLLGARDIDFKKLSFRGGNNTEDIGNNAVPENESFSSAAFTYSLNTSMLKFECVDTGGAPDVVMFDEFGKPTLRIPVWNRGQGSAPLSGTLASLSCLRLGRPYPISVFSVSSNGHPVTDYKLLAEYDRAFLRRRARFIFPAGCALSAAGKYLIAGDADFSALIKKEKSALNPVRFLRGGAARYRALCDGRLASLREEFLTVEDGAAAKTYTLRKAERFEACEGVGKAVYAALYGEGLFTLYKLGETSEIVYEKTCSSPTMSSDGKWIFAAGEGLEPVIVGAYGRNKKKESAVQVLTAEYKDKRLANMSDSVVVFEGGGQVRLCDFDTGITAVYAGEAGFSGCGCAAVTGGGAVRFYRPDYFTGQFALVGEGETGFAPAAAAEAEGAFVFLSEKGEERSFGLCSTYSDLYCPGLPAGARVDYNEVFGTGAAAGKRAGIMITQRL